MFDMAPAFAERIRAAKREARFVGAAVPNFFRKPFGPGWALVGDAGYNKDFITAQGISDAFRDAELCATALDETFSGMCSFEVAMGALPVQPRPAGPAHVRVHHPARDPRTPAARLQQLLEAVHGNPEAMDAFVRVNSGGNVPGRVLLLSWQRCAVPCSATVQTSTPTRQPASSTPSDAAEPAVSRI